jgi:hypothetical protein
MKRAAPLFALLVACGTTHVAKSPSAVEVRQIDRSVRGEAGNVWLTDEGAPRPAQDLALGVNGVFWRDPQGQGWTQSYAGVREISRPSRLLGVLNGMGIGFLSAGAVGAAVGAAGGSDHCGSPDTYFCITRGGGAVLGAVLAGTVGAVLGGVIGGAIGSQATFVFDR